MDQRTTRESSSLIAWTSVDDRRLEQGMDKSRTVMVGDRLDTDIKFGNDGGVDTLVRSPFLPSSLLLVSLSFELSLSLSLSLSHSLSLSLSCSLSLILSLSLSLSLCLALSLSCSLALALSRSLLRALSISLPPSLSSPLPHLLPPSLCCSCGGCTNY